MNISQYVSDEIVKYLKERDEQIARLTMQLNKAESCLRDNYFIRCTVCNEYTEGGYGCDNSELGCEFKVCLRCFGLGYSGYEGTESKFKYFKNNTYAGVCTKYCFNKYKE